MSLFLSPHTPQILILAWFSPDTVPSSLLSTDAFYSLSVLALPAFYTHSLFSYILDLQWKSWSISSRSVKWLQQKKWCKRRIRAYGSVFWMSYFTYASTLLLLIYSCWHQQDFQFNLFRFYYLQIISYLYNANNHEPNPTFLLSVH